MKKSFYLLALLSLAAPNGARATEVVPSWSAVEKELVQSGKLALSPLSAQWTNSSALRKLVIDKRKDVLMETIAQRESMADRLFGYFALRTIDKELSVRAGLGLAMTEPSSNTLIAMLSNVWAEDLPTANFRAELSAAFQREPNDPVSVRMLLQLVPVDLLEHWFEDEQRGVCVPTCEALVVTQIYSESRRRGVAPSEHAKRALDSYKAIPGFPRSTYLGLADSNTAEYAATLKLALEDESASRWQIDFLAREHASIVHSKIGVANLKVREEVRARIEGIVRKALSPK